MALIYDYQEIKHVFSKDAHTGEIIINSNIDTKILTPNVSINNVDYYIKSLQFVNFNDGVNSTKYLIIKNIAATDTQNTVNIIIPLSATDTAKKNESIDNLYSAASNSGEHQFNLNTIIEATLSSGQADYNSTNRIINVVTQDQYTSNLMTGISTSLPNGVNIFRTSKIMMQQSSLRWHVECENQGDDQHEEKDIAKQTAMDNLIYIIVILLACSVSYLAVPVAYAKFLTSVFTPDTGYPLAFIEQYWMIFGLCSIIVMFSYGIGSKNNLFYFLAVVIILIFISAKMSIEQSIGSIYSINNDGHLVPSPTNTGVFTALIDNTTGRIKMNNEISLFKFGGGITFVFVIALGLFGSLSGLTFRNHDNGTGEYTDNEGKSNADTFFTTMFICSYFGAICTMILYIYENLYPDKNKLTIMWVCISVICVLVPWVTLWAVFGRTKPTH